MKNISTPLILAVVLVALLTASGTVLAQDHTRILCPDCRDPNVHPSDFGNAAFNAVREPNSGYTFDQLDVVEVINPVGQWAWVNIDFEMMTLDIGFEIPTFIIPTGNVIIEVTDASARMTSYVVDLEIPNRLSVGTGIGPGYQPEGGSDVSDSDYDYPTGGWGGGENSGYYGGPADYRDAWEHVPLGQQFSCAGDFSDPGNTAIVCYRN